MQEGEGKRGRKMRKQKEFEWGSNVSPSQLRRIGVSNLSPSQLG
jgi:hypothetical protein